MVHKNFEYSFITSKNVTDVFQYIIDPKNWWIGLFSETISGKSNEINDEFTFEAGSGMHVSRQKLIEIIPNKTIVWLVTQSHLSYLDAPREWEQTKLTFEFIVRQDKTIVTFSHIGLDPSLECYNGCSTAWNQYLMNLEKKLKSQ